MTHTLGCNKGQSDLAKDDIDRLTMSHAKEILSISSVMSTHSLGKGRSQEVQDEPEIAPCHPPIPKTPRTKHEVDRMTHCGDMSIRISWGHMEPHIGGKGTS